MRAATSVELDVEQGQKLLKLIDALEDLDDVQDVFTNAEIPGDAYA
jgi:transcriptional/translational regulatory protein YebC/TACO1